ncbi:MAG: hypothetical protein COA54_13675 [Thiotrichaceae bacterium]|nr:MAG: hypothetical protein COA54_13675 [Thiotrichaceae bacterium]
MKKFWEVKSLDKMSTEEWESLCDGCALCCLVKIEDEDNGRVLNTSVSCKLLNIEKCQCSDYKKRFEKAPMCTKLTIENLPQMSWLPDSCAYKRLENNQPLPAWHYLITGNKNTVHKAGISAKWFALSEEYIHPEQLMQFVINLEK